MSRLGFLWVSNFKRETEEVEETATMSRMLLEKLLPKHVCEYISNPNRDINVNV